MTNHRTLCILIPLILGIIGFVLLYQYTTENKANHIENDLSYKSNQLLEQQQVGGVIVSMNGRDATLTGTVVSENRSREIEQIIAALSGIRMVNNQLEIAMPKVEVAPEHEPGHELEPDPMPTPDKEHEPETKLVPITKTGTVEELLNTLDLSGITSLFSSNEITLIGKLVLDYVASVLTDHSEFEVVIEGYTYNVGDGNLIIDLSQRRTQSILYYLAHTGLSTEWLSPSGFGELQPIVANDTA